MINWIWGLAVGLGVVALITTVPTVQVASAESIFEQVEYGPFSIGGRATYYDPKNADGKMVWRCAGAGLSGPLSGH